MQDEQTYLKNRVDDQIDWLGNKAASNQKSYKRLRTISLVASVLIPLLAGFTDKYGLPVTISMGALGALLAICQGLLALNRYHENWTEYRMTAEALKREKLLYETKSGVYPATGSFHLFVENAEKILAGENQKWLQTRQDAEGKMK